MPPTGAAQAQALGFPAGWQYQMSNKQQYFIDITGKKFTSLLEVRDALGGQLPQAIVDEMRMACDSGLAEGWRIHLDLKRKSYVSPDGIVFHRQDELREFLGDLPSRMTSKTKALPDGFPVLVADALEAASSLQEGYANIGLPAGWEVTAFRRPRGNAELVFTTPTGQRLKGGRAFVDFLGDFPESMQEFMARDPAQARALGFPEGWQYHAFNKQHKFIDPTGKKITSLLEVRDALGGQLPQAIADEMRMAGDSGLPEGWRIYKKRSYVSPDGIVFHGQDELREFLGELPSNIHGKTKALPAGFVDLVAGALEAASSLQEGYANIGLPAGWEVTALRRASGRVDLTFKTPTCKNLKGGNAFVEFLGHVPEGMQEFFRKAKMTKPRKILAKADNDGNDETVRSSKRARKDIEPLSVECKSGSHSSDAQKLLAVSQHREDYGYTLQKGLDGSSWNVIPEDVLCIDLDAIGKHLQMAGWQCKSQDALVHLFCNSGGTSLILHSDGTVIVQSASQQDAEEIALLFVRDWLTADD